MSQSVGIALGGAPVRVFFCTQNTALMRFADSSVRTVCVWPMGQVKATYCSFRAGAYTSSRTILALPRQNRDLYSDGGDE